MHAILHGEPNFRTSNKSELPLDIHRILNKALAKSPKDRYQTVAELAVELKDLSRDLHL